MIKKTPICVFVDARMAAKTGIGRYITGHLGALCGKRFKFIAGTPSPSDDEVIRAACQDVEITDYSAPLYSIRERLLGFRRAAALNRRVNVYWYPQYNVPWRLPKASVVTIHDLIQFRFNLESASFLRTWRGKVRAWAGKIILLRAVRQAARVVCVSTTTLRDLQTLIPDIVEKTVVIGNGVSPEWATFSALDGVEVDRRTMGKPFLLAVGVKKGHKNHSLLLSVIDALAEKGLQHRLVIIGKQEQDWLRTVAKWESGGGHLDRLIDLEEVPDRQLAAFYGKAAMLLMPSLYEGFGLPPLEAMVAGIPVICSNRGALPETVGDAAILLDPLHLDAWIEAVNRLLVTPFEREQLVAAGKRRAEELTWPTAAAKLATLLNEVARTTPA